jgi:hypothetical protein
MLLEVIAERLFETLALGLEHGEMVCQRVDLEGGAALRWGCS